MSSIKQTSVAKNKQKNLHTSSKVEKKKKRKTGKLKDKRENKLPHKSFDQRINPNLRRGVQPKTGSLRSGYRRRSPDVDEGTANSDGFFFFPKKPILLLSIPGQQTL
uniref:Uncharacterized protein n=1 Tax=Rhizophora mucronata TaxID=61149 RepID=A0A2P2J488_RHIMU